MSSLRRSPGGPIANLLARGVADSGVAQVLRTVRRHMEMDVAFISQFREDDRILEHVDADGAAPISVGQAIPLEEGYCLKVVRGELPQFIPDTAAVPAALAIPATTEIPIGSHLSVPVRLDTGEIYGTLCCFSYLPDPTLGERDLRMMRAFAEVLAGRINEDLAVIRVKESAAEQIRATMASGAPRIVFQPIYGLEDEELVGVECLSRFDAEPRRTPDRWFSEAHDVGMGLELELHAIRNALSALDCFPDPVFLGINTSAELVLSGQLARLLCELDLSRIMVEITEHATVTDYNALVRALQPLRDLGARLAIDDAGAGYASMRHILNLKSDVIKLDMSLTRDIDTDPGRRALAKGLISFAHDIGSSITAEGVETRGELQMLRSLGVDKVQGYYLGMPLPLEGALSAARSACPAFDEQQARSTAL
jgi:EAL domain-containing protein (putative c-di-GMP-specific phosphodiesterase class I)